MLKNSVLYSKFVSARTGVGEGCQPNVEMCGQGEGVSKIPENMRTSFMDGPFKGYGWFKNRCASNLLIYLMICFLKDL